MAASFFTGAQRVSPDRVRVGVIFGGQSAEHEISLLSAGNIVRALDRVRYEPVLVGIDKSGRWSAQSEMDLLDGRTDLSGAQASSSGGSALEFLRTGPGGAPPFDVAFPILHGPMGEDGTVQGLFEMLDMPYVGAGVLGSAVGMDKDVMKRLLRDAGIPITPFQTVRRSEFRSRRSEVLSSLSALKYPVFVKPANLGSSVGITKAESAAELAPALEFALRFDEKALVEEKVFGREIECAVLGDEDPIATIPGEIVVEHRDGFYSYSAKYVDTHGIDLRIPAKMDAVAARRVQEMALKTFKVLDCSGLARVDFFVTDQGGVLVNEINTLPGFTSMSMFPKMWEHSGLTQTALITKIIEFAQARHRRRHELRVNVATYVNEARAPASR